MTLTGPSRQGARDRATEPGTDALPERPVAGGTRARSDGAWLPALAVVAVVGGVLLALSLPPWGWWPLAPLGSALLFVALRGARPGRRLLLGWLAGCGCYGPGLVWATAFNWYGGLALIVVEALSFGLAALLVPRRRGRLPAFVGAFTLLEAVRLSWPFGGVPLGGVFLGQAGGPLLATARLGGPLLLTAEVWLVGGSLGELALVLLPRLRLRRLAVMHLRADAAPAKPAVAAAMVGIAGVVLLGGLAVVAPSGSPTGGRVRVTAVQGGGRRGTTARQVDPATVFRAQVRSSAALRPRRGPEPSLVVWPEDVISLSRPLSGSPQAATLAALARRLRATVLAGVTVDTGQSSFRNEVVAWGPDGRVVGAYEKVHRVPFGEYVPFRSVVSHLADLSSVPRDAVAGHGTGLLRTPAGPLGLLVSYEVFFASRSRSSVRAGAELLVVPTNTSSYASGQVPGQEVASDRVQAVESGRSLVQAAPTGYSTLVDQSGNVLRRSGLGSPALVGGKVGLRRGLTLYDSTGDLPVLVATALLLLAGWCLEWRSRAPHRRSGAVRSAAVGDGRPATSVHS